MQENVEKVIYYLLDAISTFIGWIINLLPSYHIRYSESIPSVIQDNLNTINYFIPIYSFIDILSGAVSVILIFYVVSIIMKFFKVVAI